MAVKDDYLIDSLIDMGLLTSEQVDEVRPDAEAAGEGVIDTLIARGEMMAEGLTNGKPWGLCDGN